MSKRQTGSSSDDQQKRKWRRMVIYSDSESENSESEQQNEIIGNANDDRPPSQGEVPVEDAEATPPIPVDCLPEEPLSELDSELLAALGDPAEDIPEYGEKIVQDLTQRWLPILRKGIVKDKKEVLLKELTIPENCKLLRAPTLNAEISSAISDITRSRDKKLETSQNQLGLGISAVGRGLSLLLKNDEKQNKVQAIKSISDGCRILADLHFMETQSRIKLVTPGLDKTFTHMIQDMERDESLFGSKLSEKIKASKSIEKQGLQIKKAPQVQRNPATTSQSYSTSRSRNQGNWTAPSRYQPSNRGGRGGARYKYAPAAAATAPTARKTQPPSFSNKTSTASNSKPRAPTR